MALTKKQEKQIEKSIQKILEEVKFQGLKAGLPVFLEQF